MVKKYCEAAGIDPNRLGSCGIGVHSLRKTAINDAIRNGAQMHEVREFAGHSDIRTTELYFVRKRRRCRDGRAAHSDPRDRRAGRDYIATCGIDWFTTNTVMDPVPAPDPLSWVHLR